MAGLSIRSRQNLQEERGLDAELTARLLASMEAGRLVAVCGAGLSMAPPSSLPSAKAVAQVCFDAYVVAIDPDGDRALRDDLEGLAQHFANLGTIKTVFIERLVPWKDFVRPPNPGHAAVADFLITGASASALSANYDCLIERQAWDYGADFLSSLDGDEATVRAAVHSPLLKFHGCSIRDRKETVWSKSQLGDPVIADRIAKSRTWMAANLREKDLLVIGFWSDWAYLNEILGKALLDVSPLSITVVHKAAADQLEAKAPDLWALAHAERVMFCHVAESGADVLDELRRAFSRAYLRKVLHAGKEAFEEQIGAPCNPAWLTVLGNDSEALYGLRRDAEGVPSGVPAKLKSPGHCEVLGLFHLLLRRAGAVSTAHGYELAGRTIRVINGTNSVLSRLQSRFLEAPSIPTADVIAAIGAEDFGLPGNIVRQGRVGDIVRPAAGGRWVDLKGARELLQV
jgi:hypothetical protein